ncbi:MAG: tetratricopeptide repeat protein [Candidatus Portnoybacteria bacterium]|nr:tetratricopeptide repeat protein [Candidatus Portnoybacteria bacterium]
MKFNTAWSKILIVILILFFYSLGLVHQINLPTEDLGRHLKNGEIIWQTKTIPQTNLYSYSQPDYPFSNHHWLSGLIFYFIFQWTGFNGLIIFKTILLLTAFLLVFILAVKKGNFWLTALLALPIIFILNERTVIRPEIFSYLLTSVFLYFLINFGQKPGWKIFWLIPLQLLWVNLHIYFPIGILMTAGYILGQVILRKKNLKKLSFLLLLLILVCLANPAGLQGVLQPLNIFKNYGYQIVENKSPFFLEHLMADPAILFFKIITFILILSFLFNLKRFSPFLFLASMAVVLASCQMVRNFPLLGLIALPVLSINLKTLFNAGLKLFKKRFSFLFILFLLIIIVLTLFNHIKLNNKQRGLGLTSQSTDSAAFFKKEKLTGPIFNNYDIGSYLIFELEPQEKVFVDNRPEAYPASFFEEVYKPSQLDEEKWQLYSEKYNFKVIFFTHQESTPWGRSFLIKRLADPDWALVQADAQAVILIKNEPANQPLIKKFQITKDNIEEKISSLINSSEIKMRMAALNLLELMAQYDLALQLCQEILQDHPRNGRVYLEMAWLKSQSGKLSDLLTSQRHLEKAIQLGQDLPLVYVRLGLIHFQLNQFEEAKKAWQKALQIDKDNEHAQEYLKQYQNLNLP